MEQGRKHLVIVGGSFSGLMLLDQIKEKFNVTLIDKKDHFEWIPSLPAVLVNPDIIKTSESVNFEEMISQNQVFGSHVQFVQGMLVSVVDTNTIKIKRTEKIEEGKEFEDVPEEVINFDFLAICTGSHFRINDPNDTRVTHLFSIDDRLKFYKEYAEMIEKAKSILVVGAGPTGVEVLGEIVAKYGEDKKYGLMNSPSELLATFPKTARDKAYNFFNSKHVKIYLKEKYDPNSELAKEYDLTLM